MENFEIVNEKIGATTIFARIWTNYGRENEKCQAVISRITKQGETVQLGEITLQ